MRRNTIVSLEGNIGSGKSTLLSRIASELDTQIAVLTEPVNEWAAPLESLGKKSMLQSYYENGLVNSFAFQLFVLKTRLDQVMDVVRGRGIFSERCMASHDAIFANEARRRGHIDDVQWVTYRGWIDSVTRISGEDCPQGVVYLRTSPSVCSLRSRMRSRGGEGDLPDALLEELHLVHEAYIGRLAERGVPVLLIDGNANESSMSDTAKLDIVRVVVSFVEGLMKQP